jgi:hypothetical protein
MTITYCTLSIAKGMTRTTGLEKGLVSGWANQLPFWARDSILKLLKNLGISSKESIPPSYVAWLAGATTLFLLGS